MESLIAGFVCLGIGIVIGLMIEKKKDTKRVKSGSGVSSGSKPTQHKTN